ncbi:hypothetical protein [Polaromonas sp.]|uniref:hypothetical protein n=1 Tax=Polaromonas sp. TaxID=1869339 RepID=UPI0032645222
MPISITPAAMAHLEKMIADVALKDPVVLIGKSESLAGDCLGWYVGLDERQNFSNSSLETVGGLTVFVDPLWSRELNASSLEMQANQFVIVPKTST